MGARGASRTPGWLTAGRIERFVFDYAKDHGPGARRWIQKSLRSFLSFCHCRGYTPADLSAAVPVFRSQRLASIPRALDADHILALSRSLDQRGRSGLRDAAMVCLLTTYGVRGLHLRRLRLDDIDWEGHRIRFAAIKGGRPIEQVLTAEAGNRLLAYLRQARPAVRCADVFLNAHRPHAPLLASSSLSSVIARRLRQAGIRLPEGVSHGTHSFRHAFATRLVGQVPLKHLTDMLGHRDPASTLIYAKVDFGALQQAALPWPEEEQR
jgi:site-specific recombinase XerD